MYRLFAWLSWRVRYGCYPRLSGRFTRCDANIWCQVKLSVSHPRLLYLLRPLLFYYYLLLEMFCGSEVDLVILAVFYPFHSVRHDRGYTPKKIIRGAFFHAKSYIGKGCGLDVSSGSFGECWCHSSDSKIKALGYLNDNKKYFGWPDVHVMLFYFILLVLISSEEERPRPTPKKAKTGKFWVICK